jgi:hypothetical protein
MIKMNGGKTKRCKDTEDAGVVCIRLQVNVIT